ncbi:MAG: AsmA-like C-terminal region-containing protein [Crocinitomicaceae bacterium]|nr:AsmA-like C-terminal region-containing protein [Crocinitomicaceae bacterium]MDG1776702.1 AsmA-like C-terminal region-containing protein [Crocinitomicaceae bacterium]
MPKKRVFRIAIWFSGILIGLLLLITGGLYLFKDDICNVVIEQVNKKLKAKVSVADVNLAFWGSFPSLSVDFDEVFIQDSYEGSTELDTLLYSDRIRLKLNPLDIWRENYTVKSIEVSSGTLQLRVNQDGINNYDVLKEDTLETGQSDIELNLDRVEFADFRFNYTNAVTNQEYRTKAHSLSLKGAFSTSVFATSAVSDLHIIAARSGNVTLVKNQPAKLNIVVNVNQDSSTISIPRSTISIANLPFDFEGNIGDSGFTFNLRGKNISIQDVANSLAVEQTADVKDFSGQGLLLFDLHLSGDDNPNQPINVTCDFSVADGMLNNSTGGVALKKLKLEGNYSNRGGASKEHLDLKNISFQTKGGSFKGNLRITQFEKPLFSGNTNGFIDLSVLHALFRVPSVDVLTGAVNVHTRFIVQGRPAESGTMEYHIKKCEGDLKMENVNCSVIDDKRLFESINGLVYLRNNEAGLENVSLNIGQSDFLVNGVFKNVVDYFSGAGDLAANIELVGKQIKIEDLGTDEQEEVFVRERQFVLPNNIKGTVFLDVGSLSYQGHKFDRLKGNMTISGRRIYFPQASVRNGGADVLGSLTIEERAPEIMTISSQLISKNINFKCLFKEWNNFQQDVIKSNNIEGLAQVKLKFNAPFDLRSGIISKAIRAQADVQVDQGRLKNVKTFDEIIQSVNSSNGLKAFLGKENILQFSKKLQDLTFSQLKNTLIIQDGALTIPSMSIVSSALEMNVSGRHTSNHEIDYRFGFRLRDLKQKKDSEFGDVVDDGSGIHVFMRMHGNLDDPIVEWDKQSRKAMSKENRAAEKETVKSMLKAEFGLYQNDTTVKGYIKPDLPKEELIIQFDPVNKIDSIVVVKKPKKSTKISRALSKWKKQLEEEKKEEFVIGD